MLSRWQSTIVDEQGNVQPLANLTVRLESDQSLAKMWASPGTTQPLPDGMVQADGNGYAYFYAEGGLYRITSVALGVDWRAVPLGELASMDVSDLGTAAGADVGAGAGEVPTNNLLSAGAFASLYDLQWLGTPIGGYITPFEAPPKDDPRFRYILCTAGQSGVGQYNEGVLINESVSGSGALIIASADVSLAGSPMDGLNIPLINTDGRFVGAGENEALEFDAFQNITGTILGIVRGPVTPGTGATRTTNSVNADLAFGGAAKAQQDMLFDASQSPDARTSDRTQPKTHRLPHYRRIL